MNKFSECSFRYKSGMGVTRAHLVPRIETARMLLAPAEPLTENEFWKTWLHNDVTVLCAAGENKASIASFIPFENADGELFSCHRVLAGWRHGRVEREHLRSLFERAALGSARACGERGRF